MLLVGYNNDINNSDISMNTFDEKITNNPFVLSAKISKESSEKLLSLDLFANLIENNLHIKYDMNEYFFVYDRYELERMDEGAVPSSYRKETLFSVIVGHGFYFSEDEFKKLDSLVNAGMDVFSKDMVCESVGGEEFGSYPWLYRFGLNEEFNLWIFKTMFKQDPDRFSQIFLENDILHKSVASGHTKIIDFLCEDVGFDINTASLLDGKTPIMFIKKPTMVHHLKKYQNINWLAEDFENKDVMSHLSELDNNVAKELFLLVHPLIKQQCSVLGDEGQKNVLNKKIGENILDFVKNKKTKAQIQDLFKKYNGDANLIRDKDDNNIFLLAAKNLRSTSFLDLCLEQKIDVFHVNNNGLGVVNFIFNIKGYSPPGDPSGERHFKLLNYILKHKNYNPDSHKSLFQGVFERYLSGESGVNDDLPFWFFSKPKGREEIFKKIGFTQEDVQRIDDYNRYSSYNTLKNNALFNVMEDKKIIITQEQISSLFDSLVFTDAECKEDHFGGFFEKDKIALASWTIGYINKHKNNFAWFTEEFEESLFSPLINKINSFAGLGFDKIIEDDKLHTIPSAIEFILEDERAARFKKINKGILLNNCWVEELGDDFKQFVNDRKELWAMHFIVPQTDSQMQRFKV